MAEIQVEGLRLSMGEFIERYEQKPFELINGEIIEMSPPLAGHMALARHLFRMLDPFVEANNLGEVYFEAPFVLTYTSDWIDGARTPDVMFYTKERIERYRQQDPDWQRKPFVLVPDLVVEIISKNDRYSEVEEKVEHYLADGVRLIWVLDPRRKRVIVYQPDQPTLRFGINDTLDGENVLPGLAIRVADIFNPAS